MKREKLTELKLTDEQIKAGTGLEALQQENETLKENLTSWDMDLKDLKKQ